MEIAGDGSASSMRTAQEPAAEDGAAFAGSVRATFAADLIAIRSLHSQDAAAGSSRRHRHDGEAADGEITARTWLRLLRTLCRRFAGRLIVRGTLLNHEELLVTHLRRVSAQLASRKAVEDASAKDTSNACVRVGTRFVVRCVDTETAQIGREVVARILDQSKWSRSVSSRDTDVSVDTEPVASCADCVDQHGEEDAQVLEQLDAIYGFNVRALAALDSAECDHDDEDEDQRSHQIDPTLMDFRAAQHLMIQHNIPHATGFQSFAMARHPKYATAIVTQESDARSYRSIDAAQKRRWADERFQYGQELEAKGRVKDAITDYSSCLKLNESHLQALAARGRLYLQSKQFDESICDLERVMELDPSFPKIGDDLLRAKGTLHHSRHVVQSTPLQTDLLKQKALEADTRRRDDARGRQHDETRGRQAEKFRPRSPPPPERLQSAERFRSASSSQSAKNLERDRLRELLEEENRKRDRRRKRSRYSDEDSVDDSSSRRRKDKKSSKKKSKKKKSKHKKKPKRTRDRSDSSSSSGYSSGDSYARRSPVRRPSRREKSLSRHPREEEYVHPILSRQQHRIWR